MTLPTIALALVKITNGKYFLSFIWKSIMLTTSVISTTNAKKTAPAPLSRASLHQIIASSVRPTPKKSNTTNQPATVVSPSPPAKVATSSIRLLLSHVLAWKKISTRDMALQASPSSSQSSFPSSLLVGLGTGFG